MDLLQSFQLMSRIEDDRGFYDNDLKPDKKEEQKVKRGTKESKSELSGSSKEISNRVFWLYGPHNRIAIQALLFMVQQDVKEAVALRKQLDIPGDELILPVFPHPYDSRIETVEKLEEMDKIPATIVIAGQEQDRNLKQVRKLYEGSKAVCLLPYERQFLVAMMKESENMSFPEAVKKKEEWKEYLAEYFNKKDIKIVRY